MNPITIIVCLILFDMAYLLGLVYYCIDLEDECRNGFHPEN